MITIIKLIRSALPKIIIVYDKIKIINIYINDSYTEILQDYINIYEIKNGENIADFFIFGEIPLDTIKILTSIAHFNIKNIKQMMLINQTQAQVQQTQAQAPQTQAQQLPQQPLQPQTSPLQPQTSPQQPSPPLQPLPPPQQQIHIPTITQTKRFFVNDKTHKTIYLSDTPLNLNEFEIEQEKTKRAIEDIKKDVNLIKYKINKKQIKFPKIKNPYNGEYEKKYLKKLKNFIYATTNKRYNKHSIIQFLNLY